MDQQQINHQHLVELQIETLKSEVEMLKRQNTTLARENIELRDMYDKVKQALDEAIRSSQQSAEHAVEPANSEPTQDTVNTNIVSEPQHVPERLSADGCASEYCVVGFLAGSVSHMICN